jgi:hypothetical protein
LAVSAENSLVLWLNATNFKNTQHDVGVSRWRDVSGKGNDVVQGLPTSQPVLLSNGINGLPVLWFNRQSHELKAATAVLDSTYGTAFLVRSVTKSTVGHEVMIGNGWAGSGGGWIIATWPSVHSTTFGLADASNYSYEFTLVGGSTPKPAINQVTWSPLGVTLDRTLPTDSSSEPISYLPTNQVLSLGGVSAGEPFGGAIGEFLLFDRVLTLEESASVLSYLQAKWNLP